MSLHHQFVELLDASGVDVGNLDNVSYDDHIQFDSCDVEIIIEA